MKTLIKTTFFFAILLASSISYAQYNAGTDSGTNGYHHTFVGVNTGAVNTASYNTFVGQNAGRVNTSGTQNTFIGSNAGYKNTKGSSNIFLGRSAGYDNTEGKNNTFLGNIAGINNETGNYNTFLGWYSGYRNTTGSYNTFLGVGAGNSNLEGRYNVFVGRFAGSKNATGEKNTYIGHSAGNNNTTGKNNTIVGYYAGYNSTGEKNVFIGNYAGYYESGNDKLYIDNSSTSSPLIYGDFSSNELTFNATVSIGDVTTCPNQDFKLYVEKGIISERVKVATVDSNDWCDYVFEKDYELNSIKEVEQFIQKNKHLPNVPSAQEVEENGIEMAEMDATLLRQIEELWLHMIELKKENEALKTEVAELKK